MGGFASLANDRRIRAYFFFLLVNLRTGNRNWEAQSEFRTFEIRPMEIWRSSNFQVRYIYIYGPSSSVGMATDYGLDGPGSNPGGDEIFRPSRPALVPTSYKMGSGSFPRVKCGRGLLLTPHSLLVPQLWKSRAIPLPTLWATPGL